MALGRGFPANAIVLAADRGVAGLLALLAAAYVIYRFRMRPRPNP